MGRREKIYGIMVVFLLIGYYAYSSNDNTKHIAVFNHPPVIDRFEITPQIKRVGKTVEFVVSATNRSRREIYDNCGADVIDGKGIEALAARIRILREEVLMLSDTLTLAKASGHTGVFRYTWTPLERGAYHVSFHLTSENPWSRYDSLEGRYTESTTLTQSFDVAGN